MSMRVKFDAKLTTFSSQGEFPSDTVDTVILSNCDGCSHQTVKVEKNGLLKVDYEMKPLTCETKMTDRLKMFFYYRDNCDGLAKPISAGHIRLDKLADRARHGGEEPFQSNFCSNTVAVKFVPDPQNTMHIDLQALRNNDSLRASVLSDINVDPPEKPKLNECVELMKLLDHSVKKGLQSNLEISKENGGDMFKSMFTAHIMGGEAALYNLYHLDFDGAHNYPPWLSTYLLAETLHTNSLTCDQVKALSPDLLTKFVASYAQAPMRSASATPYTPDLTLCESPELAKTRKCSMLSEVFKGPFREPVHYLEGKRRSLIDDDCEGLAALIRDGVNHLGFLYAKHNDLFNNSSNMLAYNTMMKSYFPQDLFGQFPKKDQIKLMDLAMHIGERVHKNELECKITLVSANGASYGSEGDMHGPKHVQAHACASLVCNHPTYPLTCMLEGTACIADEVTTKKVDIADESVSMSDLVNSLTVQPPFNNLFKFPDIPKEETRLAMHVTHSKGSFYRSAFTQSNTLLGAQIGDGPMSYGVDMEFLSDHKIKVHMPVQGKILGAENFDKLQKYVTARACEIHPPMASHEDLRTELKWAPMSLFKGCDGVDTNRPVTTAMLHVTTTPKYHDTIMQQFKQESDEFNSKKVHTDLGFCRTFASMDGVTKVLHMYTDNLHPLQAQLMRKPDAAKTE